MRTRQIMLDAVKKLLEKHQIDDITVQDIIDEAGVARTTFYKYFTDKYDIVNAYNMDFIKKNMLNNYNSENYDETFLKFWNFIKENKKFYKNAMKSENEEAFTSSFFNYTVNLYEECYKKHHNTDEISPENKFKIAVMANTCMFCMKKWVLENCELSTEAVLDCVKNTPHDVYML